MKLSKELFRIIIKLIGKLSVDDMDRLIGKSDSDVLGQWYYEVRKLVN